MNEEQVNEIVAGEGVGSLTGFSDFFQMGDSIILLMLTHPVERMIKPKLTQSPVAETGCKVQEERLRSHWVSGQKNDRRISEHHLGQVTGESSLRWLLFLYE